MWQGMGKKEIMLNKWIKSGLLWLWIAIVIIAVDRYTKTWVLEHLVLHESLQILPIFNLSLMFNTGAAFSFLHSASGWQNLVFTSMAALVSLFILGWLAKLSYKERWVSIALSLILGGALGNVWDRLLFGHVIDFLDFHWNDWHFAVFNVADSGICIGAIMLILHWCLPKK